MTIIHRKFPVGAEVVPSGVHFRIWAPDATRVRVIFEQASGYLDKLEQTGKDGRPLAFDLNKELNGYWSGLAVDAGAGVLYRFDIGHHQYYPDPVSRYQPQGPHGPSLVVDCESFRWSDHHWRGIAENGRIIYEMHIGTFTKEGTYLAAARELPELVALGITVIQLMPLAEFDGEFGWGYDCVGFFAPYHAYGTPDELKYFIDCAHNLAIGVILDVVYNHVGASGCYLQVFAKDYFSSRYKSEWGEGFNFDGANNAAVREFVINNAVYWIREYHFDGFRLDATQQIFDASEKHIIAELVEESRKAAGNRTLYVVAENEPQHCRLVQPVTQNGFGVDGLLNDDFHHSAAVALKGYREAYFLDYLGNPQEFISAVKYGYLYQGQWYAWQKQKRGTPSLGIAQSAFIHFLQNHDQIANTGLGRRLHTYANAGSYRALTTLLLLGPAVPFLFQGQEFCASTPFLYFADHNPELAEQVHKGRTEFLQQFSSLASAEMSTYLCRPEDYSVFSRSKLDFAERETHADAYNLHKDLLRLRRQDPLFSQCESTGIDGAVLAANAFALRFFSRNGTEDRLLLVNLGVDLSLSPIPEPLLAPPVDADWKILWSSEHPRYGGHGIVPQKNDHTWIMPGHAAVVLCPHSEESINPHLSESKIGKKEHSEP